MAMDGQYYGSSRRLPVSIRDGDGTRPHIKWTGSRPGETGSGIVLDHVNGSRHGSRMGDGF